MNAAQHVFFVDDDADLRQATIQSLALHGVQVTAHASANAALAALPSDFDGVLVTDVRMPGMDGLQLFQAVRARDPDLPVILITGHGDIPMAVQAMQQGAYDFLAKPYASARLLTAVRNACAQRRLALDNRRLKAQAVAVDDDLPLIGESPAMQRLRQTLRHIADADVDVLVEGETGAGKEVVAASLHRLSRRAPRPFVALNCGALPETVIESELFGHEAGAFTGAHKRRVGSIEYASGGTLFLDEIESMPAAAQVKLLRVLETRAVTPLGSNELRPVDLRVVAATKVDLGDPSQRGDFRADLYYRLNVVTLRLPALRERREDLAMLFTHFSMRAAARFKREPVLPDGAILDYLHGHDWPGNVRELAHYAERQVLGLADALMPQAPPADAEESLPALMEKHEAGLIRQALARHAGDVRATLQALGIPRKTFYDKLQRHGIDRSAYQAGNATGNPAANGRPS